MPDTSVCPFCEWRKTCQDVIDAKKESRVILVCGDYTPSIFAKRQVKLYGHEWLDKRVWCW